MTKNFTLYTPTADSEVIKSAPIYRHRPLQPRRSTIEKLCQLARAAFTTPSTQGIQPVVLN